MMSTSDRVHNPNPRRPNDDRVYNPNPRRPDLDQMDQDDQTLRNRHTRPKPYPPVQCLESRKAQHHDPTLELNLRRPSYDYDSRAYSSYDYVTQAYSSDDYVNQTKRATRNIRLVAPTFSGYLDLEDYLDWEEGMERYFELDEMTEEEKYKFAKLKLTQHARIYWGHQEIVARHWGERPVTTWEDMKAKLREKYLPMSYRQKKPMTHQSEPHRTSNHRYKSSPKPAPYSQPIPTAPRIHKSQIFPTTPVVPNSRPNLSLPLVQPNPTIPVGRPISISHPTPAALIEHKEELDRTNPNLVDQEPTQIETLKNDNSECCIEEVYEADLTLVEEYEGEEELIEDLEEYDNTADSTIPKGTLEEDQVIEPSSETQEQPKINEDQVSLVQYPQEAPTPLTPAKDLIQYPSEKSTSPAPALDLAFETTSYFLLFSKTIGTSRTIQLHFVKIIRSHQTIKYEKEKVQELNPIELNPIDLSRIHKGF